MTEENYEQYIGSLYYTTLGSLCMIYGIHHYNFFAIWNVERGFTFLYHCESFIRRYGNKVTWLTEPRVQT